MKTLYVLKDDQYEFKGITHNRIAVRAVVLNSENKVGVLRVYGDDTFGFRDYYETPGGGVKPGEDLLEALKREVLEEIGGIIDEIKEIGIVEDDYNLIQRHNIVYYYLVKCNKFTERHLEDYEKKLIEQICWYSFDELIERFENIKDTGIAILQKRREIPIFKIAKQMIENE